MGHHSCNSGGTGGIRQRSYDHSRSYHFGDRRLNFNHLIGESKPAYFCTRTGLSLGVMVLVLVAGISSATLSSLWATRAIGSAFTDHRPD